MASKRVDLQILRIHQELGGETMANETANDWTAVHPPLTRTTMAAAPNTKAALDAVHDLAKTSSPAAMASKNSIASGTPANNYDVVANQYMQELSSPLEAIQTARSLADSITDLATLKQAVCDFNGCNLKKLATNTVFADGQPGAQLVIVGEAPGNNEDLTGVPFCGMSGELLNQMLQTIGFKREEVYITNAVFWRPPGNRRPTDEELEICRPFVERHLQLLNPRVMLLMGATATFSLLREGTGITKIHGSIYDYSNGYMQDSIPTIPLYHPSFLLRQAKRKKEAWFDLLKIAELLA